HSCRPSAVYSSSVPGFGRVTSVQTLREGEDVTVSYMPEQLLGLFMARPRRQRIIRELFGFDCRCDLCEREKDEFNGCGEGAAPLTDNDVTSNLFVDSTDTRNKTRSQEIVSPESSKRLQQMLVDWEALLFREESSSDNSEDGQFRKRRKKSGRRRARAKETNGQVDASSSGDVSGEEALTG
ncbi:unnamed protein product, partial [Amoebophrya sp. A25]